MSEIAIKKILDQKLKKDFQITVPYQMIDERINTAVIGIQKNYNLKGFRPGQVPADLIKQRHEGALLAEESEKIINEVSRKIIEENKLKLALTPQVQIKSFEAGKDFQYVVSMELYPEIGEIDFKKIKLTKKEVEITPADIAEAISRITNHYKKWEAKEAGYAAKMGDAVNIDYEGKIDGEAFAGGTAQGYQLELGSNSFIDDFEKQLVGKKAGDNVKVKVKFPKEYHHNDYAGKAAEFQVKINSVLSGTAPELTDEFIKTNFNLENRENLEEMTKKQLEFSYESVARNLFKEELFELINKKFDFEVAEGLVTEQFKRNWQMVEAEEKRNPQKFKTPKEREKAEKEQREKAEGMVRSGIFFSEISQKNNIAVSSEELNKELQQKIAQFPGQQKMVIEFYQKNPDAVAEIRNNVLEEKIVDHILKEGAITIKKVSVKDIEKELNKQG